MSLVMISQVIGITTSLIAAGGILTLSLFDIPELAAQPASRSLPSIRWLFSRGSHIFPQAAGIASTAFAVLAYHAYHHKTPALTALTSGSSTHHWTFAAYTAASLLTISIAPFTTIVMLPQANAALIKLNKEHGGARSDASAKTPGQTSQFTDLSGPQEKTPKEFSKDEEAKVQTLLSKFSVMNSVRGVLMAAGGIVGLTAALTR